MSKRELNISDKKLYNTTKEDIIFTSPSRIPPKGIQDLVSLKGINSSECAYYDISQTEPKGIKQNEEVDNQMILKDEDLKDNYKKMLFSQTISNFDIEMGSPTDYSGN
jgi:hypothetical protein|tara:strand:+ start:1567 stop:1890 length:324 start_codon:yes stop_codon:yes gene_type:complete